MQTYRAIVGAVAAGAVKRPETAERATLPFITISRQAGAGGNTLKEKLVDRLARIDRADPPWSGWDHELVAKVAEDHDLASPLLETLDEASHSYVNELLRAAFNLGSKKSEPTELTVYRRVAKTIRALARAGRTIVVGRGGVFITADMPGGMHIYLVAPLEYRIEMTRQNRGLSYDDAAEWVRKVDENREHFYRRHWPHRELRPESFTLTINTEPVDEEAMVDAIVPLIPGMKEKDLRHHDRQTAQASR